ncbi:MAG TPA: hypothetical protein VLB29_01210 [Nocardioidaceae bacterium]|nr:hypothetical protein [Nocardioidaceae bacterium]
MRVSLLYFEGCPNWRVTDERLAAIAAEHPELVVTRHRVESLEEAERVGFHGSPSVLVDGVDVFAEPDAGIGLSCRVYRTPDGPAGAPTMEQLRAALWTEPAGPKPRVRSRRSRGGRMPALAGLGLEAAGIESDERGVRVAHHLQTGRVRRR